MTSHSFGTGWRFGPASAGSDRPEFDDSGFAQVTLPHTVVPLSWRDWDPAAWERVWMYRKRFDAPSGHHGKRVFLDFAAAMTRATVTLNGTEVADHLGGYLPFSVEVGSLLRARGNVLAVRLDSTFNLNVPPDRPAPEPAISVDYWQPGGIYRDVRLRVVPQAFLADVFAKPVSVLDPAARQVVVQATVDATAGLGAAIYQAQTDPQVRPVIAPAFYWDFGPMSAVNVLPAAMICANLDRLELFVGREHFATVLPDTDGYPHLGYPPSFADFRAVDGSSRPELRIDGYLGTGKVASRSFSADPSDDVLALAADDAEIDGDGADATRLEFRAVDRYGAPRPYVGGQVGFDVEGPAVLVGDNPFDFAVARIRVR